MVRINSSLASYSSVDRGHPGSSDALRTLLRLNASQALLYAVSRFQPADGTPLRAAITRALRALAAAIAEVVGPSQWGISSTVSDLRPEAKVALEYLFQVSRCGREYVPPTAENVRSQRYWMYISPSSPIHRHKSLPPWHSSSHAPSEIPCIVLGFPTGAPLENVRASRRANEGGRSAI